MPFDSVNHITGPSQNRPHIPQTRKPATILVLAVELEFSNGFVRNPFNSGRDGLHQIRYASADVDYPKSSTNQRAKFLVIFASFCAVPSSSDARGFCTEAQRLRSGPALRPTRNRYTTGAFGTERQISHHSRTSTTTRTRTIWLRLWRVRINASTG